MKGALGSKSLSLVGEWQRLDPVSGAQELLRVALQAGAMPFRRWTGGEDHFAPLPSTAYDLPDAQVALQRAGRRTPLRHLHSAIR